MKTDILKRFKRNAHTSVLAASPAASGGSAKGAQNAEHTMKRRPCSLAFDEALGAYRWTFQEKRSSR